MRSNVLSTLLLAALAGTAGMANAGDGQLDPGFVTDATFPGYGFYPSPYLSNGLNSVGAVQPAPEGKLWMVGRMYNAGQYRISLYRTGADGYPDVGFGDLGLRTYVRPCSAEVQVSAAAVDSQQRLLVTFAGCPDFIVYRFLGTGDLDTSFGGTGVVSIAFDQGGTNLDSALQLALTPDDGVVVAGRVATAGLSRLGIAHYTAAGEPVPGFGFAGKVVVPFEWQVPEIRGVNGAHVMADGRIVVTGAISESNLASSDKKQFVVRLLADGNLDASYGNAAPGIAKVNLRVPLGVAESPASAASWMDPDGAVLQVGHVRSNQMASSSDVFVLRWRPDGQQDTAIGSHGVRRYALDFAGPAPSEPLHNADFANGIVRQGNGRYVITTQSYGDDGHAGFGMLRLRRNFNLDTGFGDGGKIRHMLEISNAGSHSLSLSHPLLQPARIVVGGTVTLGLNHRMQVAAGLSNDLLFANTFD